MALTLLHEMVGVQQHVSALPTSPLHSGSEFGDENVSTKLCHPLRDSALMFFGKLLDKFSAKSGKSQTSETMGGCSGPHQRHCVGGYSGPQQRHCKEKRINSMPTRKSELYENCRLMVRFIAFVTQVLDVPYYRSDK